MKTQPEISNGMQGQKSTRPRTICLAITKGIWGGAQEYVYALATSLAYREDTKLLVLVGAGPALQEKLAHANIGSTTIPYLGRDVSFAKDLKSFWQIFTFLRKEKPDVLHLNSSKMGLLGGLAGRLSGVPRVIFTAHGWAFNEERSLPAKFIFFCLHYLSVLLSHATIAVSEKTKSDIAYFGIRDKITVIHNGIRPIEFFEKKEAREKLSSISGREHDILIGTIAELHRNKGVDILVEASAKLPDTASVAIIGAGEERDRFEKQIRALGLESKVFLLGRIENARRYLKAFDIFILPSRNENLPYALLEAGQAGCPAVASRVGGMPEVIDNGESGILVTPGNSGELSRAIQYLMDNPAEAKRFGNNLKQKVEREFSAEKMVEMTLKVYENF